MLKRPEWHDFGPTFASEQLAEQGIDVSKETLRQWMIEDGIWKSRAQRISAVHVWLPRRSCFGELVQWDTSTHDWLEGRGEAVRYLVRLTDDATSRSGGRFVWHDSTRENMGVFGGYVKKNGRPVDTYTDLHGMFVVPQQRQESAHERRQQDRLTQIGRALRELSIGWIPAYSPQAKGRIERDFRTDQDRLVKQLRLAKVKTMRAANAFLENEYWPEWNERFARPLDSVTNLHRPLTDDLDLNSILSHVETRVITPSFTVPFEGQHYQIASEDLRPHMRGKTLRVELHLDGILHGRYEGRPVRLSECGAPKSVVRPASTRPVRRDHNAGGKSNWMDGFLDEPTPPLWRLLRDGR
jgi:hypothetical protein